MAKYLAKTKVEFPEIKQIQRKLQERFAPNVRAKFLGAALKKATKPGSDELKRQVRQNFNRVSGNLLRSVSSVVRRYPKTGNAVGLVGFEATGLKRIPGGPVEKGKNRGYHAGRLIFGTERRRTDGPIASTYRTRGAFILKKRAKRGKFAGSTRVRTTPRYPKAFFKRAPSGESVDVGRIYGNDVITKALRASSSQIRKVLREQMSDVVERAARYLESDFARKNRR